MWREISFHPLTTTVKKYINGDSECIHLYSPLVQLLYKSIQNILTTPANWGVGGLNITYLSLKSFRATHIAFFMHLSNMIEAKFYYLVKEQKQPKMPPL